MDFKKLKPAFKLAEFYVAGGITLFVVLILGVMIGMSPVEEVEPEIKEVENIVEKEVVKEVCKKEDTYKEIISLDTELIGLQVEALNISADSFDAISEYDVDRMNTNTKLIENMTPKVKSLSSQRMLLLEEIK